VEQRHGVALGHEGEHGDVTQLQGQRGDGRCHGKTKVQWLTKAKRTVDVSHSVLVVAIGEEQAMHMTCESWLHCAFILINRLLSFIKKLDIRSYDDSAHLIKKKMTFHSDL
jgi:hypothetical protein